MLFASCVTCALCTRKNHTSTQKHHELAALSVFQAIKQMKSVAALGRFDVPRFPPVQMSPDASFTDRLIPSAPMSIFANRHGCFGCFVTSHGFSVFILRLPKSEAYRVEPSIPKPSKLIALNHPFQNHPFHIHSSISIPCHPFRCLPLPFIASVNSNHIPIMA